MPYPSKTSRQAILDTALSILERDGVEAISMRTIAATLHLAPNALYRYYADHNTLLAAIGNEGMRQLLEAQRGAVNPGPVTLDTIRNVAFAYLHFARQHRALYQIIMVKHQVADEYLTAYAELDSFTFDLLRQIVDETVALEAGVALWGYLHGMISIEQLDLYREGKPHSSIEFGLNALLVGIMHVKTTDLSSSTHAPEETPL